MLLSHIIGPAVTVPRRKHPETAVVGPSASSLAMGAVPPRAVAVLVHLLPEIVMSVLHVLVVPWAVINQIL